MKKTCLLLNIVCLLLLGVTEAFAQKNEGTVIYSSPYTIYTPHYGTSVSSVNLTPTNAPKKSKKQKQAKAPKSDQYKDEVNLNIEMPQSTGSRSVFLGVNYGIGFQIDYDPTLKTGVGLDFAYPITNNFGLGAYFSIGNYVSFGALTTIGDYAFNSCSSLESLTIGDSVATIGYAAFVNCENLNTVYCKAINPPTTIVNNNGYWYGFAKEDESGNICNIDCTIYVPTECVEAYKSAQGWSEYADDIVGYDF